MMTLLLSLRDTELEPWVKAFKTELPDFSINVYPQIDAPEDINYAVVWKHPYGDFINYPNLKAILSCGAGIDHIINDDLPENIPIVRLNDEKLTQDMCLYAIHWVLHFHGNYYLYKEYQKQHVWRPEPLVLAEKRRIGIMGMGNIGTEIAQTLVSQNFFVSGWGATKKTLEKSLTYYYGNEQIEKFLSQSDILINVLPLTNNTKNLITESQLRHLPVGAFLINIGRGGIINELDLLKLLDDGHLSAAALDVFEEEPLPEINPLWSHPNVYVTPHIAGQNNPESATKAIVKNILRIERGDAPFPVYSPNKGY